MAGTFYGPHECGDCGETVVRAAREDGGAAFDVPDGQVYPNTVWQPHACDPDKVEARPQPNPCTAFGRELKQRRTEQRRSLRDLEAQTGVSAATINRMERGEDAMLSNAARVAHALGINLPLFAVDVLSPLPPSPPVSPE